MGSSEDYEEIRLYVSNPNNQSEVQKATKEAWADLVRERGDLYEDEDGYTGTFAEKRGVVIAYFPQLDYEELEALGEMIQVIEDYPDNLFEKLTESGRKIYTKAKVSNDNLTRMNKQWNDKWGSALAITNGSFVIFMGVCSS